MAKFYNKKCHFSQSFYDLLITMQQTAPLQEPQFPKHFFLNDPIFLWQLHWYIHSCSVPSPTLTLRKIVRFHDFNSCVADGRMDRRMETPSYKRRKKRKKEKTKSPKGQRYLCPAISCGVKTKYRQSSGSIYSFIVSQAGSSLPRARLSLIDVQADYLKGNIQTYKHIDRWKYEFPPRSIGHCPLLGLLPKRERKEK